MLPTQLVPDDEGKYLRVRLIQKEGSKLYNPTFLFDEGSTISWIPCGRKLTCSFPGIKMFYGPDTYFVSGRARGGAARMLQLGGGRGEGVSRACCAPRQAAGAHMPPASSDKQGGTEV